MRHTWASTLPVACCTSATMTPRLQHPHGATAAPRPQHPDHSSTQTVPQQHPDHSSTQTVPQQHPDGATAAPRPQQHPDGATVPIPTHHLLNGQCQRIICGRVTRVEGKHNVWPLGGLEVQDGAGNKPGIPLSQTEVPAAMQQR